MAVCDFVLIESRPMLRGWFALLDEGVEAIEARLTNRECVSADLYAAALAGDVDIRLVRVEEEVVGFLAVQRSTGTSGNTSLHVWMLYLRPGCPDIMGDVVEELEFIAGTSGCSAITFHSTRLAWSRRLARHGFAAQAIVFSKEVAHEGRAET